MKNTPDERPESDSENSPSRESDFHFGDHFVQWTAHSGVRRALGLFAVGIGSTSFCFGVGPIGLSLILLGTAVLLVEFEDRQTGP